MTSTVPFTTIIKLTLSWCKLMSIEETGEKLSVDPLIVRRAYMQIRDLCQQWLEGNSYFIGGHNCEVHVELLNHQIEIGNGKKVKVLCGFCPRDDRGFVSYNSDLSDENVHSLLKTYVAPGSSILSASWDCSSLSIHPFVAGFKQGSQPNLARKYFTQLKNKQSDKCHGIALKYLNSHMSELMWREVYGTGDPIGAMDALLYQIAEKHNVYDAVPALLAKDEKTKSDAFIHFPLPQDPEEAAYIFSIINSEEAAIAYLQEHKCIISGKICDFEGCNKVMRKYKERRRKGYAFGCSRHPTRRVTLRRGTLWEGSKLDYTVCLKLMFCWAKATSLMETAELVGLGQGAVIGHLKKLREVCSAWLRKYPPLIGGTGKTVQLEIFDHRVDARKAIEERIVLGYSQSDERGFVRFTKHLSSEDICNLVKEYVAPGSTIISTSWEDYASVQDIECDPAYEQGPYNKSRPSLVHDYWLKVKQTFDIRRGTGFGHSNLDLVCKEFIWRSVYGTEGPIRMMETMLSHLRELFPVCPSDQDGEDLQALEKASHDSYDAMPNSSCFQDPMTQHTEDHYLDGTACRIVRSEDILPNEAILTENTNLGWLSVVLEDEVSALEWCVKHR